MAEKWQDLATLAEIHEKINGLNGLIDEVNSTRRDWHSQFTGSRCYYALKSWDYSGNGSPTEQPGTGSAWVEVVSTGSTSSGLVSPTDGSTFSSDIVTFHWTWDSSKTPSNYTIQISSGLTVLLDESNEPASHTSRTVSGLPTNGSPVKVSLFLFYTDGSSGSFERNFTSAATGPGGAGAWVVPANGANIGATSTTAQWNYGTKTPVNWTLTVTNVDTSSVLNTYSGTTSTQQLITGLPNDGSFITLTLNVNYTDGFAHSIGITFTNGVASAANPDVGFTVSGSTYSGEMVTTGGTPRWETSIGAYAGAIQTAQQAGVSGISVYDQGGTIIGIKLPNTGLTTLTVVPPTRPLEFDLQKNVGLSIPAGTVDFSAATKIDLLDVGSGVFIRDQDITPAGMTYFNICNCQDHTITGPVIGQMSQIQYLCLQGINLSLTDAHMSAANYNQCTELRAGYNQSMAIGAGTLGKMPNLQLFHCPSSLVDVTAAMFTGKNALTNIDVAGRIGSEAEMNAVLAQIRSNADTNNQNNGNLIILSGNPAPTGGASNADLLAIQARSWSVS